LNEEDTMNSFLETLTRRRVLRGMLGGSAVTVGLPLLNVFLNGNGTALADGSPMPIRFGTWGWGLGMSEKVFTPKQTGANWELPEEIESLRPVQKHINLFTGFNGFRDAAPNLCHTTGWVILRSGHAPMTGADKPGETIDVTVAKKIGTTTRFPMLTMTATGDPRDTQSYESATLVNTSEGSALGLYTTVFGPDFQDPNAPEFKPNPKIMVRQSVISSVMDNTKKLQQLVGAEDKQRIDQYFTGLRDLEKQFERQLTKPEPREACVAPKPVRADIATGVDYELVNKRHQLMTDILVMRWPAIRPACSTCCTRSPSPRPRSPTTRSRTTPPATRSRWTRSWATSRWCPGSCAGRSRTGRTSSAPSPR
jgi:hypothetical protein